MVVMRWRFRKMFSTIPNILKSPDGTPTTVDVDGMTSSLTAISSSSSSLESQMAWSFVGDGATSFPLNVLPAWEGKEAWEVNAKRFSPSRQGNKVHTNRAVPCICREGVWLGITAVCLIASRLSLSACSMGKINPIGMPSPHTHPKSLMPYRHALAHQAHCIAPAALFGI